MCSLKEKIKAEAARLGFCLCGFTSADPLDDYERYTRWLESDPVGTMGYLKREDHIRKRSDPRLLLPEAVSICVLGVPMRIFPVESDAVVASYAHYRDYHDGIMDMAGALVDFIQNEWDAPVLSRICVDSAPLLERSLAVRAGLGWIGKSSMFIHPKYGSAVFLCEILLNIPLEPDAPFLADRCGSCTRCVDACPNHCIDPETRTIQADRCAAYLTIEHKGNFTEEQSVLVGEHLFGCDTCVSVCPWNRGNVGNSPLALADVLPSLADEALTDEEFKSKFRNSPVLRAKAKGLRRNIAAVKDNLKRND